MFCITGCKRGPKNRAVIARAMLHEAEPVDKDQEIWLLPPHDAEYLLKISRCDRKCNEGLTV